MSTSTGTRPGDLDHDVVIVGGGPTGCAAGLFTARYGLETVIFDRGSSSLRRCAYLSNYLGFPGGIDIETFSDLMHDHVETVGCAVVPELVESVSRSTDESAFVVETQAERRVTASRVIAASWYDGSYLRPLGGDEMFELHDHHGEERERFDPDYADGNGRTPVDGLYVGAPAGERNAQALIAAGHGAHVARSLLEDLRVDRGYPEGVASHYDWLRPATEFSGEWNDRDRWREWFANQLSDEQSLDETRLEERRETYIDRAFETKRTLDDVEQLTERGYTQLLEHIDDDRIRAYLERKDDSTDREPVS